MQPVIDGGEDGGLGDADGDEGGRAGKGLEGKHPLVAGEALHILATHLALQNLLDKMQAGGFFTDTVFVGGIAGDDRPLAVDRWWC